MFGFKKVNQLFAFTWGGKEDFGKCVKTGESINYDLLSNANGYAFAIRNCDGLSQGVRNVSIVLISSCGISDVQPEIKTTYSNGCAASSEKTFNIMEGKNTINISLEKAISKQMTELVIFFKGNKAASTTNVQFTVESIITR